MATGIVRRRGAQMDSDVMAGLAIGHGRRAIAASAAAFAAAEGLEQAAAHITRLKNENATLQAQARIDSASILGMKAQIAALKLENPKSPLLANSGKTFKDGEAKTKLRLIYEDAFDAVLRKVGITSPRSFRED